MKPVAFSVFALAGLAVAQFQGLPTCAQNCADDTFQGSSGYGGCGTNAACICANKDLLGGLACCLAKACSPSDQTSAVVFASQICGAQGVSVPSTVSCSTTAATGATTTTAATTTTTGTSSGTSSGSSSSSSTSSASAASNTAKSSSSTAWAPRQTGAHWEILGGLVAAAAML